MIDSNRLTASRNSLSGRQSLTYLVIGLDVTRWFLPTQIEIERGLSYGIIGCDSGILESL